ncbi:hypothetical protein CNMCM5623_001931 [Aspergillus felis]|uniref:Protein kinase domain-containing protein n=1 Tax=Aspergillus felis TaxID=1287682 RepID=A0A8H6QB32_9EURO|nr:hypothetical protein CNMCM5623_001931 [Aspergillus felis]
MEKRRLFSLLTRSYRTSFSISRFKINKRGLAASRRPSDPRLFPTSGWDNIDSSIPVEEETIPTYRPKIFYPVHIGEDQSILSKFETAELEAPVPRKTLEDRTIYISRSLPISYGTPVLCDLGEARLGTDQQQGDIMPDIYRAPEVILDMTWNYKVDIWNVGMVIWDLFEHRHLFRARNPEGKLDDGYHLAEMQAVLGDPPLEFLARSEKSLEFWDGNGKWKGAAPVPDYDLDTLEERLQGDEKDDFLRFLRRMICWQPEERATAKELLFDPWLMHGLFK